MSRKKYKKEIFIYFIIYNFLYMVDGCILLLYLVEVRIKFIDWKFGDKRDGFFGVVKSEKLQRGTLCLVEYTYWKRSLYVERISGMNREKGGSGIKSASVSRGVSWRGQSLFRRQGFLSRRDHS